MATSNRVFLVEDNIGDSAWLIDLLESRGYIVDDESNEKAAKQRLERIKDGELRYALAVFDIMVSTLDFMDAVDLDDAFFEESQDTGVRLCRYAREGLGLSEQDLPIVCLSARDDIELKDALKELGIPFFSRTPQSPDEDIRAYIERNLPRQHR